MNTSIIRDSLRYFQGNFRLVSKLSRWIYNMQTGLMYSDEKLETSFIRGGSKVFNILVKFANRELLNELFDIYIVDDAKKQIKNEGIIVTKDDYLDACVYVQPNCRYSKTQINMLINDGVNFNYNYFISKALVKNISRIVDPKWNVAYRFYDDSNSNSHYLINERNKLFKTYMIDTTRWNKLNY